MIGLPSGPLRTVNGQCFMSIWTEVSSNLRPINLLASKTVLRGFIATWFLAASPIRRSVSVKPTYEGVVLLPWSFAMISTRSFCQTPTQLQHNRMLASTTQPAAGEQQECTAARRSHASKCLQKTQQRHCFFLPVCGSQVNSDSRGFRHSGDLGATRCLLTVCDRKQV